MFRKHKPLHPNAPLRLTDHSRPRTRREFIAQGFMTGAATVAGGSVLGLFANPRAAYAALSGDISTLRDSCGIVTQGAGKIPVICFDLAGGANISGSNVLVGGPGGQEDFLSTAGYNKLGLPGDRIPSILNPVSGLSDFVNRELGLAFHAESAMLQGITEKVNMAGGLINGAVIPARSDNDTGNNPHNPMYGMFRAGADGELLTLVGSQSSDSGANSMAPDSMIDLSVRPTKVDQVSDVTGLVDTGQLVGLLDQSDAVAVMESIQRITDMKLSRVDTMVTADDVLKDLVSCGYVKAADLADRYGNPGDVNPALDCNIVGPNGVFNQMEFDSDSEFRKAASIMKLVVNGYAGAGTITMGGYDYHTGDRATGELRDLRAGRCIGACLEYAAKVGVPLMVYVYSDGSVFSNGTIDNSPDGGGKGVWTGDNSSTAASYMLVYNPAGAPQLYTGGSDGNPAEMHQQIGWMRPDASVDTSGTPASNNVNLLVETVVLNYMALHGEQNLFGQSGFFPSNGLGNAALMDSLIAFEAIAPGGQIDAAPPSSCPA
jgi:hypothetical protein